MSNDEIQMTKKKSAIWPFYQLFIQAFFVIRHSCFVIFLNGGL